MISVKYYQGYRNMQILANCNNPLRKLCRKLCETRSNGNVKLGSNQLQPYHVSCTRENKMIQQTVNKENQDFGF